MSSWAVVATTVYPQVPIKMPNVLRNLPSVGELLESPPLKSLIDRLNRNTVVSGVRHFLDDMQSQIRTAAAAYVPAPAELALRIAEWIGADKRPAMLPVINATGNILHPGLGGAPLADEAIAELAALTRGYVSVELDLNTGGDVEATAAVEQLLIRLTGAEAATVTGTLSGAALGSLAAIAAGREVIVARGQVTSIDDGYRLPDLFAASGSILREVGTANETRLDDYANAIHQSSAAILRLAADGAAGGKPAADAGLPELADLSRRRGLTLIECLGAASLVNLLTYGISGVPLAGESNKTGADLTLLSGAGFIGGPPCGIILGRRQLIEKIVSHPLLRAVRADKLTLATLGATLRLYEDAQVSERAIPVLSLIATPLENLRQRAERLGPQIAATGVASVEIVASQTFVAGQESPGQALPTMMLALTPREGTAEQLAKALRTGTPAIVGRVSENRLLLDLRSVMPREDMSLVTAMETLRPEKTSPVDESPSI